MSKLIPDSDSTQTIGPEKCHCFHSTISKVAAILCQSSPKSDHFFCSMQTRQYHPYVFQLNGKSLTENDFSIVEVVQKLSGLAGQLTSCSHSKDHTSSHGLGQFFLSNSID